MLDCCSISSGEQLSPQVKTWQLLQNTRSVIAKQQHLDNEESCCLGIQIIMCHVLSIPFFNPFQKKKKKTLLN